MNATRQLQDIHQSLWLDNITRGLLTSGTLRRYISEFAITGLTSKQSSFVSTRRAPSFRSSSLGTSDPMILNPKDHSCSAPISLLDGSGQRLSGSLLPPSDTGMR